MPVPLNRNRLPAARSVEPRSRTAQLIARSTAGMVLVAAATGGLSAAMKKGEGPTNGRQAFVTLKGSVENATIGPWQVSNVFRAIESNKNVHIRNLTIDGVRATDLGRDGIRIRGDAVGVRIRNFALSMRGAPQATPNLPIGIAVQEGRRIAISDGVVSGFRMRQVEGKYTNGDGVATERPVDGLSIVRVRSSDNSDGGFDLKSTNVFLDQLTAERNGRNYRFWGSVRANRLTSNDPRNAHLWIARGAEVHIASLTAKSNSRAPLIRLEGQARVDVDRCVLSLPRGTKLVAEDAAGSRVRLGPGCAA